MAKPRPGGTSEPAGPALPENPLTTVYTISATSPTGGPYGNVTGSPAVAEDSSGDIWAVWAVDLGSPDYWSIELAEGTANGATWSSPKVISDAGASTLCDGNPDVAINPSSSVIDVSWDELDNDFVYTSDTLCVNNPEPAGHYYLAYCTTLSTCATSGTWTYTTDGDSEDDCTANDVYSTAIAFDSAANLLVAGWCYNSGVPANLPFIDEWTSGETFDTYGYILDNEAGYFTGLTLTCGDSTGGCVVGYGTEPHSTTEWEAQTFATTGTFFTGTNTNLEINEASFSGCTYIPGYIGLGGIALPSSGTNTDGVIGYVWYVAADGCGASEENNIAYAYSTDDFQASADTTLGSSPAGASINVFEPTISLITSGPYPVVSWTQGTTTPFALYVNSAQSISSAWGTEQDAVSGVGNGIVATNTVASPFRVDIVFNEQPAHSSQGGAYDVSSLGPSLSSPALSASIVDVGQSTSLSATDNDGIPVTYSYTGLPTGCSSANSNPLSCTPTATTGSPISTMVMKITDAWGFTATVTLPTLTINSALTGPTGISTTPSTSFDINQAFSASATLSSTGTPTYSWRWYYILNSGPNTAMTQCAVNTGTGASGGTLETCSVAASGFSSTGSYQFFNQQGDSASNPDYANSAVTSAININAVMSTPTLTPSSESIDAGQTVAFQAAWSGGTSTYTAKLYYSATSPCSTSSTLDLTASGIASSPYTFSAVTPTSADPYWCTAITDSSGAGAETTAASATTTITVNSDLSTPTLTPASESIDNGQTVAFQVAWSGGTAAYTAKLYYSATSPCSTSSTLDLSQASVTSPYTFAAVTPTSADPYWCAAITDSSAAGAETSAASATVTITVNAVLSVSNSPGSESIDSGQTVAFQGTWSGGTSTFTAYLYSSTTTATCSSMATLVQTVSSATSPTTFTAVTPAAGTDYYCVWIKDSSAAGAETGYSSSSTITVNAVLSVTNSPGSEGIDSGQSITFQGTWSGGTSTFTAYLYSSTTTSTCSSMATLVQTVNSATSPTTFSSVTPAAGTDYYCVWVKDSSAAGAQTGYSPTSTITVHAILSVSNSPGSETIDSGQTIAFQGTWSGGTSTYTAKLYSSTTTSTCSSMATLVQTVSSATSPTTFTSVTPAAGTDYYCVWITDSSAAGAETGYSLTSTITVNTALSVPTMSPTGQSIDDGQSETYSETWSGGTSSFTAALYTSTSSSSCTGLVLVQSISSATSPQTFASVSPGTTTYYCSEVTDSSAAGAVTTVSVVDILTVLGSPTLNGWTAGSTHSGSIEAGQQATFTVQVPTGGAGTYTSWTWTWTSLPSGCSAANSYTITCTPTPGGVYTVSVYGKDANNVQTNTSSETFIVQPGGSYLPTAGLQAGPAQPDDLGLTVYFTSNASGGTGVYVDYAWSESSPYFGCDLANAATIACTPTALGSYTVSVRVTDSDGATSHGQTSTPVTVNDALVASSIAPSATTLDLGQSVDLTTGVPTGGTAPYTYQWLAGSSSTCWQDAALAGATSGTLDFAPTATTYLCMEYGDSSSGSPAMVAFSNVVLITVDPALVAGPIAGPSPSIDSGQVWQLVPAPLGGTTPYQYEWFSSASNALPCTSGTLLGTGSTWSASPTSTAYYCYLLTDSSGGAPAAGASSSWDLVKVDPSPAAGAISPAAPTIDLGQTLGLSTHASGGTAPYTYQWFSSISGIGACSAGTAIPGSSGSQYAFSGASSEYVCYTVTDSSSAGGLTVGSPWLLVTVSASLQANAPSGSVPSIDEGQSAVLSSAAVGGSPALKFQWYELPTPGSCGASSTPLAGATSSSLGLGPSLTPGTYYFCYGVTDSSTAGAQTAYSSTIALAVFADPSLSAIAEIAPVACSTSCAAYGQETLSVAATAGLGSGGFRFDWTLSSGASFCAGSSAGAPTSVYSCVVGAVSAAEVWSVSLTVVDSDGCAAPGTCAGSVPETFTATLHPAASLTPVVEVAPVSCTAACSADQGQELQVQTTASGGSGSYVFTWTVTSGSSACSGSASGATTSTYACTVGVVSSSETWSVSVSVPTSSAVSFSLTLFPDPSVSIAPSVGSGSIAAGQLVTFSATAAGGSGAYSAWSWTSLPGGCTDSGTFTDFCRPSVGGVYSVSISVKDSNDFGPVTTTLSYTVQPGSAVAPSASLSASSSSVEVGDEVTLTALVSGGLGAFSVSWEQDGATIPGAAGTTYAFEPGAAGSYSFVVVVTFANGTQVHSAPLALAATPRAGAASSGALLPGGPLAVPALALGLLLLVALLGLALLRKRRNNGPVDSAPARRPAVGPGTEGGSRGSIPQDSLEPPSEATEGVDDGA